MDKILHARRSPSLRLTCIQVSPTYTTIRFTYKLIAKASLFVERGISSKGYQDHTFTHIHRGSNTNSLVECEGTMHRFLPYRACNRVKTVLKSPARPRPCHTGANTDTTLLSKLKVFNHMRMPRPN